MKSRSLCREHFENQVKALLLESVDHGLKILRELFVNLRRVVELFGFRSARAEAFCQVGGAGRLGRAKLMPSFEGESRFGSPTWLFNKESSHRQEAHSPGCKVTNILEFLETFDHGGVTSCKDGQDRFITAFVCRA